MFRGNLAGTLVIAVLVAVMVAAVVAFLLGVDMPGDGPMFSDKGPRVVALVALLIVIGGSMLAAPRQVLVLLKWLAVWALLGLSLVTAYTYRSELDAVRQRVSGTLLPGTAMTDARTGTITVIRDRSRHYRINASVNGAAVGFLVDTGASVVTLTARDARAAGIDTAALSYTVPVSTANGISQVAAIRLESLEIDGLRLTDLRAFVAREEALETSLFGLSALDRLSSWRVEGDRLILQP
ncbi:TIGR02281 family clan AA aspartic protease [Stappia sp. MMSF_3263]|uniref:retropepsin-like aspartic protease family protein n=1 Tax=Stappia sp. MMSF_3263 TaxID=3046693 RepID=UPI00273D6868|nr:TIGR02281 family clan AA aspartic protease [Stappia sp. MMSF_3263]